jgi:putative PIN family toxin of toxin-antitoxin system
MKIDKVFVFDTNSIVSAHLIAGSVSDQAFQKALRLGAIAISETTMIELVDVLYRKKFDKYFNEEQAREKLIQKIEEYAVTFSPSEKITVSIDPDDNMFLELAVASQASCIISGDPHLHALNPFREIPILSASDFLKVF